MAMPGQSSFRRVLISRVLLISVPILLIGVAVTFRKARTSLLETARHNLIESAVRKADTIQTSVQDLQVTLDMASRAQELREGSPQTSQAFLDALQRSLPAEVSCLQLTNVQTGNRVSSTCQQPIAQVVPANTITSTHLQLLALPSNPTSPNVLVSQIQAIVQVPVYDASGQIRYVLASQSIIRPREGGQARSFLGYTVVLDEQGTFLAHPIADWVGRSITEEQEPRDVAGLRSILNGSAQGNRSAHHLFNFSNDGTEWLAGYSPLTLTTSPGETETYTVLAVTRLEDALQGLNEITRVMVWLMAGLLGANLLAMLFLAKELAEPIEKLGQYALRIHQRDSLERVDNDFKIRELNNLSKALDTMVNRLEERAQELETAWQEAEAANQLKSEFLANTSHELRTPLNAIIGCIRLVRDDCCDSEEEEMDFLDRAFEAATHLLKIINDLLDIAKIEAGTMSLSFERLDIRTLLQDVIDLQAVHIHQKGLSLTAPEILVPLVVKVDPAKLKQVFLNVIYNAIKFTDQGGITIQTRVEPIDPSEIPSKIEPSQRYASESQVVIAVRDTGIGIDPNQQHKLFRPFVMVDGTTTRKFEGTGLGLAISRNLMALMGGSISLHSAGLDQGTTVEIRMPLMSAPSAIVPPSESSSASETVGSSRD